MKVKANEVPQLLLKMQGMETRQVQEIWLSYFQELKDPRRKQGIEHNFLSIVIISVLAVIGGAVGWEDIELYATSHEEWLRSFLGVADLRYESLKMQFLKH